MLHLFIPVIYVVLNVSQVPLVYDYCVVYIVYSKTHEEELMDTAEEGETSGQQNPLLILPATG